MNEFKINSHLINLLPEKKIAYDNKAQEVIKNIIEGQILSKVKDNNILERVIKEITKTRLEEGEIYQELNIIIKNLDIKIEKKYKSSFSKDYIGRLLNIYIKIWKTKTNTEHNVIKILDSEIDIKLNDDQKSLALYIITLMLLKNQLFQKVKQTNK